MNAHGPSGGDVRRNPGRGATLLAPQAIPTLDTLADHPGAAEYLSREVLFRLYQRAHVAEVACLVALGADPDRQGRDETGHDELINAREVALVLGRSVSWVQQRARTAPLKFCLIRSLGRGLLFSRRKIDRLIAQEAGQTADHSTLGLRGVNAGRRPRRTGTAHPLSASTPEGESGGG